MKTISILLFLAFAFSANAQNNIESTVQNLKNSELYNECIAFKNTFEKQTESLGKSVKTTEDYQLLQKKYLAVATPYDVFLKDLKKDLLKTNTKSNANIYLTNWTKVKQEYNQNFLIFYNSKIGGKGISDELLKIGKDFLVKTFNNIKRRVVAKNETLNKILGFVNDNLFNKIQLKGWSELTIQPVTLADSATVVPVNEAVTIPEATLSGLGGKIIFAKIENGQELPMDFRMSAGKDIIIEKTPVISDPQQNQTPPVSTENSSNSQSYKTPYLESSELHNYGTKFKLKAESTAFIYVMVLNSTGIMLLHPNVNYSQSGKDITVTTNSSPTVGSLTIPSSGLFTISKSGTAADQNPSEDFAILISKSELNFSDLIEKMNASMGPLDERIAIIFADKQITHQEASVNMQAGEIQFKYDGEKNVLPLVFKINKLL